ncbi:testis-expressed protein 13D-like [Mustela putorius furo]|uniref:Testis-expressed protein 13D-like n=1 Tax=Mustela putorius furo TaxID=9669 RepID=A0A8U0RFG5_MUSPF|nr:testis-expressed protein 13D-like [Mustela putorius furo]
MAVDFGDHASGFRHTEVIRFINNEVLLNGGGPDFYVAFRSRPWNEVEDRLRAVVADPQMPHAIKRACAWSALALSVRVGARQREQQECRVHWLQEQVEERETAAWALASELQRLCRERKEVAAQLRCAQAALQHVVDERNVLRGRLLRAEKSGRVDQPPQEVTSESGAEQGGAAAWPGDMDEKSKMMATEAQAMHHLEARMAAPASAAAAPASAAAAPAATAAAPAAAAAVPAAAAAAPAAMLYVQALPSSWAQALQTSLPVQVPHPFPFSASFQMGFPYWAPLPHSVVVEADTAAATTTATAVPLQMPLMPPLGVYPPGQWAAVGVQEQMAPLCEQRFCDQEECSETFQGGCPLGDSRSQSQDEGPVCPQGKTSLEDSGSHSQKDLESPQGTTPLEDRSSNQKECPLMPQEKYPLENSKSHSQEDQERPQGTSPLGSSRSSGVIKSPKKQQPPGQKSKPLKGKKVSDSQLQEKPASGCSPKNWDCPWCKAMNFSWCTTCYQCKKVCVAVESGGLDTGEPH